MPDITDIERLNYYEGEFLGAVDFEAEQEYHRDMRRRHNIGPHTWGIVTGLDIAQFPNGGANNAVDVYIQPGVAVDGFGREIVVLSPTQLTAEMFADFPSKQTLTVWIGYTQQLINPNSDTCAASSQTNAYSRVQESFQIVINPIPPTSDPMVVAGNNVSPFSTTGWTQPTTLPPLPTIEGSVVIAPDDSVPFQELPDDNTTATWLVQLGQVLWDGKNQIFVQTANGTANQNRQYVGSVAATIFAPAGTLIIQDRSTPSTEFDAASSPTTPATIIGYSAAGGVVTLRISPALATPFPAGQLVLFSGFKSGLSGLNGQFYSILGTPAPGANSFGIANNSITGAGSDAGTAVPQPLGVAVEVQGTLTVDDQLTAQQDIWLNGANTYALRFKDIGGADGDTALNIQRLDGSASGADLHIHIGDGSSPKSTPQRLTVGYGTSGASQDTNALIVSADGSVTIPAGPLSFGGQSGSLLQFSGGAYGIGVEASTLFLQSAADFAFCVGGDFNATQTTTPTATLAMSIDSEGDIRINRALVVDDGDDNAGQLSPGLTFGHGSGEGISSKRTSGGNQYGLDFYTMFDVRLSIDHEGQVGIGTTNPGTALDVFGGISVENGIFYLRAPSDTYHHIRYGTVGGVTDSDGYIFNSNFVVAHGPDGSETARLVVQSGGNVGIGTTTPAVRLDVNGDLNAQKGNFSGDLTGANLKTGGAVTASGSISGGSLQISGNATVNGNATFNGTLTLDGKLIGTSKSGYVVDRFYSRGKKPLERGDVVALHSKPNIAYYGNQNRIPIVEVTLASKAADTRVCGVVDEPSLSADETADVDRKGIATGNIGDMVTLGAYAFCKVTAETSPIEPGDLLTTSETAGHAQRLDPAMDYPVGCVIGKALAGLDKGRGVIPVLISQQ